MAITSYEELSHWTPSIFSKQRTIRLELVITNECVRSLRQWFTSCVSMRSLHISSNLLKAHYQAISLHIDELWVDVVSSGESQNGIAQWQWNEYLTRGPTVSQVVIIVFSEDSWYKLNGRRFLALSSTYGINVRFQILDDMNEDETASPDPGWSREVGKRARKRRKFRTTDKRVMDAWDDNQVM